MARGQNMDKRTNKAATDIDLDTTIPSYYVGIGASAGGLEAIEEFFKHAPTDTGMGFIVVQHLSPTHKSLMVELLSRNTDMPVLRAEDGMKVKPNSVYLVPPNHNLKIFHGALLLDQQDHDRGLNLPIDIFFKSLAEDQEDKAIAIVLSGTGSDGARGIRTIKEKMGMVMAQDADSAKFDGMPKSAIATGMCDFIMAAVDMPMQLMTFAKHPYASRSELSGTIKSDEDGLTRIFYQLRDKTGVDFTFYKPSTLLRRIERRLLVNQLHSLDDYVHFMESNSAEVMTLHRELLIGVTNFFRDRRAFDLLEETYLPELIRQRRGREFRIWVAGCSTGEEAYSLAILCRELIEKMGIAVDVKIFATDVDRNAVIKAGNGVFSDSIAADIPSNLLAKYFSHQDDSYHITRNIREMVVFAQQNLIKDPPFTNMDLITCRNLLIYLQPVLQRKVMELFNFSLRHEGILFLGASETIGDMSNYFEPLHNKWKLYRSRGKKNVGAVITDPVAMMQRHEALHEHANFPPSIRHHHVQDHERMLERLVQSIAGDYLPLALVVNEQLELQYIAGDTDGFFKLPSGKVQNNIATMAIKELAIPISTGIQKAFSKEQDVIYSNISIRHRDTTVLYDMKVKLLPKKQGQLPLAGVFLIENRVLPRIEIGGDAAQTYDVSKEAQQRIVDLEQSLQFHKENLQATVEELETSNEELQATNEELMASNEELQSTNEELQSVNEELYTVNAEYQNKIIELTESNNDLENLNASTQIATIFLDENLNIRKFTPMFSRIYKIISSDVGRPFSHLSHLLLDVNPLKLIEQVLNKNNHIEQEVVTDQGDCFLMRIQPYHIAAGIFSGVVLTFIDINAYHAEHRLLQSVLDTMLGMPLSSLMKRATSINVTLQ
ncbi:MAG: chemotaxis protein CheR [Zetaproteobacteria bacterium CG_4_9_14_3_um_filter_54_145]|nr:MAG: chemotaxis protein CheR [Zetaproteobacteria bacterium CG_4_10_14_3_um_filter_54_28]PJA29651.1 MAG: chemotaxis protein CheR [Zetaproteobacteria bacterium CG_4_9_14_3_um_filter_54_145]